jgi:hypothetical protein
MFLGLVIKRVFGCVGHNPRTVGCYEGNIIDRLCLHSLTTKCNDYVLAVFWLLTSEVDLLISKLVS